MDGYTPSVVIARSEWTLFRNLPRFRLLAGLKEFAQDEISFPGEVACVMSA
jgi:hypothetical protein